MDVLPVSGWPVQFRELSGFHDAILLDTRGVSEPERLAILLASLCQTDAERNFLDLPTTDADLALLQVRSRCIGDAVRATATCSAVDCAKHIDLDFLVSGYVDHHRPKRAPSVMDGHSPGWFKAGSFDVRPPTLRDEVTAACSDRPTAALWALCVDPVPVNGHDKRRVESALSSLAPQLANDLEAVCPECGRKSKYRFDPRSFVLQELTDHALQLEEDVHYLASAYHWSLDDILSLPRQRRTRLADLVHNDRHRGVA